MPSHPAISSRLASILQFFPLQAILLSEHNIYAAAFSTSSTAYHCMPRCPHSIRELRRHSHSRYPLRTSHGSLQFTTASSAVALHRRSLPSLQFGSTFKYSEVREWHSSSILFQSMEFSEADANTEGAPSAEGDSDPTKWEEMYYAPMQQPQPSGGLLDPPITPTLTMSNTMGDQTANVISDTESPLKSDIRVVTFDLDNTIWKTSATISDANDVLANHLKETFKVEERSEKRMGQLFKQFPDRYAGVDFSEQLSVESGSGESLQESNDYSNLVQNVGQTEINLSADATSDDRGVDNGVHIQASFDKKQGGQTKKKPVYLTLLRKDAIRSLLQESNNDATKASPLELESQVDSAFDLWVHARCQSISRNFAPSAVETLANLRSLLTSGSVGKVYIGAITDGNSNPNMVEELSGFFDFVIRAEDVGASKPDKRVYKAAVAALMLQLVQDGLSIEEFFLGESLEEGIAMGTYIKPGSISSSPSWKDVEEEAVDAFSEAVGQWWVHVGDDFFKDVVAAKEFQMRAVWTRELIGGKSNDQKDNIINGNEPNEKQRTVADLVNDVSKSKGTLQMSIGASEFLTNSLHDEFSDAVLDRFGDLSGLLAQWNYEGMELQPSMEGNVLLDVETIRDIKEPDLSRTAPAVGGEYQQTAEVSSKSEMSPPPKKFCVFCGGQLPAVAKFCSNCGERQV
eukprot:CAMPEP_0183733200 /NCGR_PEP_ID=MMETSP0737-20130205/40454_1 /TAXON_ID=385413 /ORGANISM="Thalassiosira miniscula, Strain CCMP1093" /LENGTH=685 /DNA_ID=CAMNT_0025966403 /DNA_START=26 /DNA_END=2083 /DNA_ORIENTATION=+